MRQPPAETWVACGSLRQRLGSHAAASGRDLGRMRQPPAETWVACGSLWQRLGSHAAASGRDLGRMRQPPAETWVACGSLWQRLGSHAAASGRDLGRMRQSLAETWVACGSLRQRLGSHAAVSGRDLGRMRQPPAETWVACGSLRQRLGSHAAASGRDLGRMRPPPAETWVACGSLRQRLGSHAAVSGRDLGRMRPPPAETWVACGSLRQRLGSHAAASGRDLGRMRPPPAETWVACGSLRQRLGSHAAASGRDLGRMRQPPAETWVACGRLRQRLGSHAAASGRVNTTLPEALVDVSGKSEICDHPPPLAGLPLLLSPGKCLTTNAHPQVPQPPHPAASGRAADHIRRPPSRSFPRIRRPLDCRSLASTMMCVHFSKTSGFLGHGRVYWCILGVQWCALICVHCSMMNLAVKTFCFFTFFQQKTTKRTKTHTHQYNPLATGHSPSGQSLVHPCREWTLLAIRCPPRPSLSRPVCSGGATRWCRTRWWSTWNRTTRRRSCRRCRTTCGTRWSASATGSRSWRSSPPPSPRPAPACIRCGVVHPLPPPAALFAATVCVIAVVRVRGLCAAGCRGMQWPGWTGGCSGVNESRKVVSDNLQVPFWKYDFFVPTPKSSLMRYGVFHLFGFCFV